ncbi:TfoX/Sxy family protein [Fodinibius salsisoli]|uniref:TfoX/Sxy family protein n=1 Tax=Fodinibius salsisoli TaxID=2820877 RepID=A0ABT3PHY6_9BACT|nr:TfoX/Sxy family protein [Fodinibius salsisoli]MCW9705527.1 TfoX/Sxy family protein [Fodinibius salsisoli]
MAYNEKLADRIRQALGHQRDVEEKKMFGGLAFMVHGKMCVTAGADRIMCRIAPDMHETVIDKEGCQTVIMREREYKGWVYVNEENIQSEADFNYWIDLALDYNKKLVSMDEE